MAKRPFSVEEIISPPSLPGQFLDRREGGRLKVDSLSLNRPMQKKSNVFIHFGKFGFDSIPFLRMPVRALISPPMAHSGPDPALRVSV